MCLGIPMKIVRIDGDYALVQLEGVRQRANISMLDKVKKSDYIIIHAGFGIKKLDEKDAKETLEILKEAYG